MTNAINPTTHNDSKYSHSIVHPRNRDPVTSFLMSATLQETNAESGYRIDTLKA